ncbi:hypothetical protein HHI36_015071 [Cryptolaemus montrouzieri]|uniref:Uncharacterized protein n=1 Tax=Cryptolaemus montrouzieri TaxID=559131 RepID=A0ABD2N5P2_9CUCU
MKIPFYSILGPLIRSNQKSIRPICAHPLMAYSHMYTGLLGFIGMILSLVDIVRIIKCGPILPGYMWRSRIKNSKLANPELERDLKLIFLSISLEYYIFLILGCLTQNAVLFLPFLCLYAFIILMEGLIFFMFLFVKCVNLSKINMAMIAFVVYNWMAVFCAFQGCLRYCDM